MSVNISELEQLISQTKNDFYKKKGSYDNNINSRETEVKEVEKLKKKMERLDKVKILYMKSSEYQREQVRGEFEQMVTSALQYIKNQEYYFEIEIDPNSPNGADAEFFIKSISSDGKVNRTTVKRRGHGIANITTSTLNIAMLEKAKMPGPLILDEPASNLSRGHLENYATFLKELSNAFDRQIILNTHSKEIKDIADTIYEVILVDNMTSKVTEITD